MVVCNRVTRNNHGNFIFVYLEWLDGKDLPKTTIVTILLYVCLGWLDATDLPERTIATANIIGKFLTTKLSKI